MATKKPGAKKSATKKSETKKAAATSPVMSGKLKDAAKQGDLEGVRTLLDRGIDPNVLVKDTSTLALAVYWDRMDVVMLLLERGADPNLGTSFPCAGCAMHSAASEARLEMLPLLLERGGDPNARGQNGGRPLQTALKSMRLERGEWGLKKPPRERFVGIIKALLAAGARAELEDDRGESAWNEAARADDAEVFTLLAETNPAVVQSLGKKLLAEVAAHGAKLIDVLVAHGVPPDQHALVVAITRDNAAAIERLLANGVDPSEKVNGKTALELARQEGSEDAVRVLSR